MEGQILRAFCKASSYSREEIAHRMGIAPDYLSALYKKQTLTEKVKTAAANALGIQWDEPFCAGQSYPQLYASVASGDAAAMQRLADDNKRLEQEVAALRRIIVEMSKAVG